MSVVDVKSESVLPEQFPRSSELPNQSPLYWVSQKDRYLRQLMIKDIEALTGRRLVVYFANRFMEGSEIDDGDPSMVTELLSDINPDEPIDLMIETNGGKTDSTEAIVSILQNRISDLRVIVANAAKSNGTLICLSASTIVMGPTSELGPIDPHIQGTPCTILALPEMAAINFPLHNIAKLFLKQTQKLAENLLKSGMMKGQQEHDILRVVEALSTRNTYFSHGSTIDCREAVQLGLKVETLKFDCPIWNRIWLLYSMYDFDARRDNMLKIFEGRSRSTSIKGSSA